MNARSLYSVVLLLGIALGIGWAAEPAKLKITATPAIALYGEPFSWKVTGLQPGERVTIKASSQDARRNIWESQAVFEADPAGVVDIERQAPVS